MPDLDMTPRKWVYRLWSIDGKCLYVGQHRGWHPSLRISQHRDKPWWRDVDRADYTEVVGDLDDAEQEEIKLRHPVHNVRAGGNGHSGHYDDSPLWKHFRQAVSLVPEMTAERALTQLVRWYLDPWGIEELPPLPPYAKLYELATQEERDAEIGKVTRHVRDQQTRAAVRRRKEAGKARDKQARDELRGQKEAAEQEAVAENQMEKA